MNILLDFNFFYLFLVISGRVSSTPASVATTPATGTALTFRQLEESINKWSVDLDEQEKIFLNQAASVATWDRLLVSNGEKVKINILVSTFYDFDVNDKLVVSLDCGIE